MPSNSAEARCARTLLVDGFAWDKLDAQFVTAMLGMFFRSGENHADPSPGRYKGHADCGILQSHA